MSGKDVPTNPQILPSERAAILEKIKDLPPLDLDKLNDAPVEGEAVRSGPSSLVPGTAAIAKATENPVPLQSSVLGSAIGNEICRSCAGRTVHACVNCCFPCHNPVNSWRDTFGMEQRCSVPDAGGQEVDHLCRICAKLPPAEPRREEDNTPFDDLSGVEDDDNVQNDEQFQATQVYVHPGTPPVQPQQSHVDPVRAITTAYKPGDPLPAPYPLFFFFFFFFQRTLLIGAQYIRKEEI